MEHCFTCIPLTASVADETLAFALANKDWHRYYNFEAALLPSDIAAKERLFVWLADQGFEFHIGVLKMPPNTCYKWHTDTDRPVGINLLLTDNGSRCLFADSTEPVAFPFVELAYQPNKYYVFNTQVPHTVLNFSGVRYLLSVEFLGKDRGMTYAELCNVFKD